MFPTITVISASVTNTPIIFAITGSFDLLAGRISPILGTAKTPYAPFFSPDGSWVGFYARADGRFEKISIIGGAPVPICDVDNRPWSATWGPNKSHGFVK